MKNRIPGPRLWRQWAMALAVTLFAVAYADPPKRWAIFDVGAFGSTGSEAWAINNRGDVVGFSSKPYPGHIAEIFRGFLWQNGVMQDIGSPIDWCQPTGINDRGTIVAHAGYGDESWLLKDGYWVKAGPGIPYAINRSDDIAGQYWSGTGYQAFVVKAGAFMGLGTLGGMNSTATAINDKGVAVGSSDLAQSGVAHAFVYRNGVMRDLGTLGHEDSHAADINNHGVIVGYSRTTLEDSVAFIAEGNDRMRRLFKAAGKSYATGINDRGTVVGVLNDQGFLYDDEKLVILENIPEVKAAGWTRLVPSAINDRGWITGKGLHSGSGLNAFVLVPKRRGGSDFGRDD
jgi:probable HAF family extracellular repeat protein